MPSLFLNIRNEVNSKVTLSAFKDVSFRYIHINESEDNIKAWLSDTLNILGAFPSKSLKKEYAVTISIDLFIEGDDELRSVCNVLQTFSRGLLNRQINTKTLYIYIENTPMEWERQMIDVLHENFIVNFKSLKNIHMRLDPMFIDSYKFILQESDVTALGLAYLNDDIVTAHSTFESVVEIFKETTESKINELTFQFRDDRVFLNENSSNIFEYCPNLIRLKVISSIEILNMLKSNNSKRLDKIVIHSLGLNWAACNFLKEKIAHVIFFNCVFSKLAFDNLIMVPNPSWKTFKAYQIQQTGCRVVNSYNVDGVGEILDGAFKKYNNDRAVKVSLVALMDVSEFGKKSEIKKLPKSLIIELITKFLQ